MMMIKELNTTQKTYLLAGMGNLFRTGSTSCMDLERNLNVKFVVGRVIGAERHLKNIFNNGDMLMV